ncbi:MAG: FprA family A-type flavoprotein [Schwartzia sp.]|nr:FprA family A-type flavoprotein [Schwartzia sp. (in: firmicutes)]MBR1885516.1 FprA family A-type flavoprotein [Schwartzia sp. (in: firmicutes)]
MKAIEMKKGIYWAGAVDWSMRSFHGYSTRRGSSYNAYLLLDEKITLIDTVKAPFVTELLERVSSVVDPQKIDYIVSNHVEPDHSGSLPILAKCCPNAKIVTSAPNGLKGLTGRYGELPYQAVKTGETLSLGARTLSFVATPMLHWPDSMVTYCPEEKILFSNDAFGQHLAANRRFDDENDLRVIMEEAKKYYANILMLYGKQAQAALSALGALPIEMILTGHGVSWRAHIPEILGAYKKWSAGTPEEKAVVVFDSMWGSTERLARAITDAFTAKGVPVAYFDLRADHISDVITEVLTAKYLAVGSPTINNQMMPPVAAFLCYLKGFVPKGRQAFAFGSFGWGGQSVALVEDELKAAGLSICLEKVRVKDVPTQDDLAALREKILAL